MKHKALFKNKDFSPFSNVRKSKLYLAAKQICATLQNNNFEAYIVGGAIRDLVIKPNALLKDLDLATSASPEDIFRLFKNTQFVGEAFGVCLVKIKDMQFEVTTFRKEGKYLDRRKPESISKGTFEEDSKRRDFTINCLYFNPVKNNIIDPHNGLNDIKNKRIHCVGNPEDRLHEDALRILRMARFAANLNFYISNENLLAAKKQSDGIHFLSKERILLEFQKVKLGRFYHFTEYLNSIFNLKEILFDNFKSTQISISSLFKNKHSIGKIKIDTQYPFFNFMKSFLFKYELDSEKSLEFNKIIEKWPLCNEDKKICLLFLKCINLKNKLSNNIEIELLDFIFYEQLLQINIITKNISYGIFINLSVFIKDNLLKETLYKMIESSSKENALNVNTSAVIKTVENHHLDKKFISAIIKYLQYIHLKKGFLPELVSIIQFKTQFFKDYFEIGSSHDFRIK